MDKSLGHSGDERSRDFPLKLAISQIVGEMPPFHMKGAYCFADLEESTQDKIEDWCSNKISSTTYGYWMTGSSVVDAAEVLVKLAVEGGNIQAKPKSPRTTKTGNKESINLEDFVNQKTEDRNKEAARQVAQYERGLPSWLKCKDWHCPSP